MRNFLFKFTGSVFLLLLLTMSDTWKKKKKKEILKQPFACHDSHILHTHIWGVFPIKADVSRILRKSILQAQETPTFNNHRVSA